MQEYATRIAKIREEMHKGLVGQEGLVDGLLIAMIANGHVLIEGVPGLAKTRAVNLLALLSGCQFKRIQFTPDLLPADIVGSQIFNQETGKFVTRAGPVFTNFCLADEINRAPAKVQSALLETMQERQVTIADRTHMLPKPFFVFATQNPVEQEGTYPLPEAQLDRFLMKLVVGYPSSAEEEQIVKMVIQETALPALDKLLSADEIIELQQKCREIYIDDSLVAYATRIVEATRDPAKYNLNLTDVIEYGASPRGSISLATCARAKALIHGRDKVLPEDIKDIAVSVLRHRIILTYHAEAEGIKTDEIVLKILSALPVP
ncbi:MAG: MoxR family ATPase [Leptospiraceae bacterium]|nr:MoxR family ATPase [Leptospiraceae bacterium]MCB1201789.1 MoxR family ATPase [Leptospiraceae bacterium]